MGALMPRAAPPVGDYYLIVPMQGTVEVMSAVQVYVAAGTSEEDAVAKVAPLQPQATLFVAQVAPAFDPPAGYPKPPPPPPTNPTLP